MDAFILIGEPGAGKSTLAEFLTADLAVQTVDHPFAHRVYACGVTELGKRREGGFGGTDALSLSVQPKVVEWLTEARPRLLFFEGDRLSNDSFFTALRDLGYTLRIYQLWGKTVAAEQRAARGSSQDPTWLKGRQSKVAALRSKWGAVILPAGAPLAELEARLQDPVAEALRAARKGVLV